MRRSPFSIPLGIDMFEAMGMNRLFYITVTTCDFDLYQ